MNTMASEQRDLLTNLRLPRRDGGVLKILRIEGGLSFVMNETRFLYNPITAKFRDRAPCPHKVFEINSSRPLSE